MQQKMGKTLVLFPLPLVGHQNPMFELGNILYSKGFSISVIHTHFNSPIPAKYPHFSFHFIDDGLSRTESSFDEIVAIVNLLNEKCVESFKTCLSHIITDASYQEPVACLISDFLWYFSQAVADNLKIPRIVLRTGSMTSFIMFSERGRLDLGDKKPEDLIPNRPPLRFKDIIDLGTTEQSPVQDLISKIVRQTVASKGIIFNSFKDIEDLSFAILQQEFSMPSFPIGPFHKWLPTQAQDISSLSWLDSQAPNSVLYVSFGSLATIDEAAFLEMAWGLANSNQPFLWVVRDDLVHKSDGSSQLPDEFLHQISGRYHIIGWAPQKEVLAHPAVGGFWTHGGWNSMVESICEGVPVICSPSFGDQMMNTRYVIEVWKIGLRLEKGSSRDVVEMRIRKLMAEKEGEEMRERVASLKSKAINCLLPEGSSCKYMEDLANLIISF